MAYLKKTERYNIILQTAMDIIIQDGIAAITARRVAAEANIAVGQIHHHFKSVGQLKAQALINVTEELINQTQQSHAHQDIIKQIINIVSPIEGKQGLVMRKLWNEAVFLADRDQDIKQAYQQSTEEWHKTTVELIEQAITSHQLINDNPSELAWRLIALSCGLDNLATIEAFRFNKETTDRHITALLKQ